MTTRKEQEILQSEVAKFYDGKTILITGAAGYLGTVLLEILLRCCPGVHRIYILLREKKGVLPEQRKETIFKKEIFDKIKKEYPEMLDKVIVIPGDVSHENLGMNDDDLRKVAEEVSIVFHLAASIQFSKPIKFILFENVIGTYNIIELCRKLKHIDALGYTSTAFSNCNRKTIDEIIYKMPFKAEDILETIRKGSEEELHIFFEQCTPNFPNFYTFSKCVSENLLLETAADLPVSIVRPTIIVNTWKGSSPGYIEAVSGLYYLIVGTGKGFIRVAQIDKHLLVDLIPADIVANTHLVAAWRQITEKLLPSPSVYNCASSDIIPCTWNEYRRILLELFRKYPLPNSNLKPSVKLLKNKVAYWVYSIIYHYSPAIVIDTFLWLCGRKPRLFKQYLFYHKLMSLMLHFSINQWKILSANFQSLASKLNFADSELFPVDIRQYSIAEAVNDFPTGDPMYKWKDDKKSFEERKRTIYMRYLMVSFIKWPFIGFLIFLCYKKNILTLVKSYYVQNLLWRNVQNF